MDKEFGDLVYEAWMRGKDPDGVSMDAFDNCLARGFPPDEITLEMVYPEVPKEPVVHPEYIED